MRPIRLAALAAPDFRALRRLDGLPDVARVDSLNEADVLLLAPRYGATLREVWSSLVNVRWIHALGAGVDTFPFDLLRERHIVVTNSAGVYADALAEFAIAAMLWFAKDLGRVATNRAAHRWEPFTIQRLEGATAGIIGYGGIGRAVGRRCEALGMRVLARGRTEGPPLDELVPASDYLVLSTPLTAETRRLIDSRRIAQMRSTAVLINICRGAVIDEAALIEALQQHRIRGAALDVFENEPLPPDHPLWRLDNALISPHTADHTSDSHERAMELFLRNLERFRHGQPLEKVVDLDLGY